MEKNVLLPIISGAMKVPGVKVNREEFLIKELKGKVSDEIIENSVNNGTKAAGVPVELIEKLAKNTMNSKALLTVTASFLSGLPGGLIGLLGGSSADVIQYYANFFNLAQKLMYLYGYKDISELDSSQEEIMIVVLGAASGVEVANAFLKKILSETAVKWQEKVLAQQFGRSSVKIVADRVMVSLGRKSATRIGEEQVAKIFGKAVPIIGGLVSGILSAATFKPMAKRLNKSLNEFYTYNPTDIPTDNSDDIIDVDDDFNDDINDDFDYDSGWIDDDDF